MRSRSSVSILNRAPNDWLHRRSKILAESVHRLRHGALLLGYYENGRFAYAGRAGNRV